MTQQVLWYSRAFSRLIVEFAVFAVVISGMVPSVVESLSGLASSGLIVGQAASEPSRGFALSRQFPVVVVALPVLQSPPQSPVGNFLAANFLFFQDGKQVLSSFVQALE